MRRPAPARSVHDAREHGLLAALKARHDPDNVFRFHPAAAATPVPEPAVA
nr:BBE domain-containing protein [Streptomyces natalensis]